MKALAIAWNTFRESIRDKILYNLLIFALIIILSTVYIKELTVATQERVIIDLGLAGIGIFGTMMAIFLGIGLVYKEIDRRTIYTIVSKPISRRQFLLGKFLGQLLTLGLNLAIMLVMLMAVMRATLGEVSAYPALAVAMLFLELMVLTAIAMLFSSFTTPTLSTIFTLSFWVMGHLVADMRAFARASDEAVISKTLVALTNIIPDLERFNLKNWAIHGGTLDGWNVAYSVLLGLLYSAFFLAAAAWLFERKDFK